MQIETLETKRTAEGAIDIRHYARIATTERREARAAAVRTLGRISGKGLLALVAIVAFWNISPMGAGASKEAPYR